MVSTRGLHSTDYFLDMGRKFHEIPRDCFTTSNLPHFPNSRDILQLPHPCSRDSRPMRGIVQVQVAEFRGLPWWNRPVTLFIFPKSSHARKRDYTGVEVRVVTSNSNDTILVFNIIPEVDMRHHFYDLSNIKSSSG